jgi:hypothetical protein
VLKRNTIANYLGTGWAALMAIAFVPLYIGYLGIEAFGIIGLFVLLQAWLTLLDLGMTPTLNREMARFTAGLHSPEAIRDILRSRPWLRSWPSSSPQPLCSPRRGSPPGGSKSAR